MDIYIKNLVKEYDEYPVLDIECLSIKEGALVGIIGPNGAGKSTLIRIIAGLDDPSKGEIYYNNSLLEERHYRQMTLVFQKPYLLRTTVYNDIAYPLKLRKATKDEISAKVNALMEEMGLSEFKDKKTKTLSGGEMQKVALARAMIFKPKLLMLDEPTANIDPSSIAIMEKMIRKINNDDKTTVIIITHSISQAKRLCKDIVFMNKGRAVEYATTDKVLNFPQNPMTKAFVQGELLI